MSRIYLAWLADCRRRFVPLATAMGTKMSDVRARAWLTGYTCCHEGRFVDALTLVLLT